MPDLRVAHLSGRQADIFARRAKESVRTGGPQAIESRRMGLADGIVGRVLSAAPAVHDHEHHRAIFLHSDPLTIWSSGPGKNSAPTEEFRWIAYFYFCAVAAFTPPLLCRLPTPAWHVCGSVPSDTRSSRRPFR